MGGGAGRTTGSAGGAGPRAPRTGARPRVAWRVRACGLLAGVLLAGAPAPGGVARAAEAVAPPHITGSNRLEYGVTRTRGDETFEDLFRVALGWRGFTADARLHINQPSSGAAAESLDQRAFGWADDHLDILAGNFYETWGRGLLLRAYESRSATVGRVERSLAFDRDIDGVRVRGRQGPFTATLLSGRPLLAPVSGSIGGTAEGRPDRLRGARLELAPAGPLRAAANYLRVDRAAPTGGYGKDIFASGEISATGDWLDVTLEGVTRRPEPSAALPHGDAFYSALSAFQGPFALTWEFKDYNHMNALYNEPPTLVKTQSWTLLNRATHVVETDDDLGHQVEARWSAGAETGATLTHARSDHHDEAADFRFREWTLEGRHRLGVTGTRLRAVADRAEDRLKGDRRRWTLGGEAELPLDDRNSLAFTAEWQQTDPLFATRRTRRLGQIEFQHAPWLTVTAQGEKSVEKGAPRTRWGSLTVNLAWGAHNLNVYYGSRPAGFLCTGGYCFFAPAFDGFELRLLSRF